MTVTPANVGQVADVVREVGLMGFGMLSFQPAAYVGDDRRWHEEYRGRRRRAGRGVGARSNAGPAPGWTTGCSRTATCAATAPRTAFYVGPRWHPVLDGDDPRDRRVRGGVLPLALRGVGFAATPPPLLVVKLLRLVAAHPRVLGIALGWAARSGPPGRGSRPLLRHGGPSGDVRDAPVHGRRRRRTCLGAHAARMSSATTPGCARRRSGSPPATTRWAIPRPEPWSRPACSTVSWIRGRTPS